MSQRTGPSLATIAIAVLGLGPVARADTKATGSVVGMTVVMKDGSPLTSHPHTVVYLEGVAAPAVPKTRPQLRQKNLKFDQRLMVVQKGTTVDFPNQDRVFHNVFSFSEAATFDLGLYKSGSSKSVAFDDAGEVQVYCNIHPDMISTIEVVDSSYYTIAADDGSFRIDGAPPGTYPIVAVQPGNGLTRGTVKVTGGGVTKISLQVEGGQIRHAHLRKDGTPYGRYK